MQWRVLHLPLRLKGLVKLDELIEIDAKDLPLPQDTDFLIADLCNLEVESIGDYHFYRLKEAFDKKGFKFFGYFLVTKYACIANGSAEVYGQQF